MKLFITALVLVSLSGCAEYIETYNGYKSAAALTTKSLTDTHLDTLKFEVCATPFSAIIRNPEWIDPIRSLCVGSNTTVEGLLNQAKGE